MPYAYNIFQCVYIYIYIYIYIYRTHRYIEGEGEMETFVYVFWCTYIYIYTHTIIYIYTLYVLCMCICIYIQNYIYIYGTPPRTDQSSNFLYLPATWLTSYINLVNTLDHTCLLFRVVCPPLNTIIQKKHPYKPPCI